MKYLCTIANRTLCTDFPYVPLEFFGDIGKCLGQSQYFINHNIKSEFEIVIVMYGPTQFRIWLQLSYN
jgi:hypothetical protein